MNRHAWAHRRTLPIALAVLALVGATGPAISQHETEVSALELRLVPAEPLFVNRARHVGLGYDGTSPYYDLILQAIFFVNRSDGPLMLKAGTIDVLAGDTLLQQTSISMAEVERAQAKASAIAGMGFDVALDVLYSASSVVPEGFSFSPSPTLPGGSVGLVDDYYLIVRSLPDRVRVKVQARDAAGSLVRAAETIAVEVYESPNDYILPVEPGEWYLQAFPGLRGHHRWTAATEHAYDITKVDSRGSWAKGDVSDWRTGRVPRWTEWYAYDKKVLAAADGTVVKVVSDVEFPLDFWNRRDAESLEEYRGRLNQKQMELFLAPGADPAAVAGGNHILIEHSGGEYSYYAHLAHGTLRVAAGDPVRQGQHIAGLGGTGEAPMVHLHFQVMDGPSLTGARTLPVRFSNITVNEAYVEAFAPKLVFQPGFFVQAAGATD